jgi:hypothetical protein
LIKGNQLKNKDGTLKMKDNSTDRLHYAYMFENGILLGVTNDVKMAEACPMVQEANRVINDLPESKKRELGLPLFDLNDKIEMMHTSEFNEIYGPISDRIIEQKLSGIDNTNQTYKTTNIKKDGGTQPT